ncbi:MAG TPA: hypothetical protein VIK78_00105 [Ruminiclostridium sp.]
MFLKLLGEIPVIFLKTLLKYKGSSYPTMEENSETRKEELDKSSLAAFILVSVI